MGCHLLGQLVPHLQTLHHDPPISSALAAYAGGWDYPHQGHGRVAHSRDMVLLHVPPNTTRPPQAGATAQ